MNTQHLFQPKINGNVSFRQQTIKFNDENGVGGKSLLNNANKSAILIDESQREFTGRDITNLTVQNQENINPSGVNGMNSLHGMNSINARKPLEVGNKESKHLTVSFILTCSNSWSKR